VSLQLAAVYSSSLIELLTKEQILIDRIVVYPWHTKAEINKARSCCPILLHNMPPPFVLNHPNPFDKEVMDQFKKLLTISNPDSFSMNLVCGNISTEHDKKTAPCPESQSQSQVYLNVCRNALRLKEWLQVPLALRNMGLLANDAYEYASEPLFITAVLDAVSCDFALDIAHARTSAHNLQFDLERYLRSLPLFRAREIIVSGPRLRNGIMIDTHGSLQDDDWQALDFVLARTSPQIVTLEYTGKKESLQSQLERMQTILQAI